MPARHHRIRTGIIALALSLGITAGLARAADAAPAKPLRILTSFYPIYVTTLNITKDVPGVEVQNLTKPLTGCLHDYQMTPDDAVTISKADVFVINGADMEGFLDKALRQNPRLKVVEAAKGMDLLKDAHGHPNPHVWVSVTLAMTQARTIAGELAAADPAHAALYRANGDAYVKKLGQLRERMHAALKDVKSRKIITFHEAFPYFAAEFGLEIVAVVEREPGSEPSAAELIDTIRIVRAKGVKALFVEPQYPAKSAETVSRETGAAVHVLDPVVTGPLQADAYLTIMETNLATLQRALR